MNPRRAALHKRLHEGPPLLLDGPTGTELERVGVDTGGPLWSGAAVQTHAAELQAIHAAYARAGADVHTAATFRLDRAAAERAGLRDQQWRDVVAKAVDLARQGATVGSTSVRPGRAWWISGSMAPLGDCYSPEEVPNDAVLEDAHRAMAEALASAGVDLVLIETMNTIREAVAATRAALAAGLPAWTSFVVTRDARLLSGEPLDEALERVVGAGAACVLVNCSSPDASRDAFSRLATAGVPWGIYPNGSRAEPRKGWTAGADINDDELAGLLVDAVACGARVVGTCCGTTPRTIGRLHAALRPA